MNMISSNIICSGYSGTWSTDATLAPAHNTGIGAEGLRYFYHTNHLGSASMITNSTGLADQHIQYLPFGELFVSQRNSTFDSRYKFTAKELDNETNYTYFGARYYDSDGSFWLSVDPMASEYPGISPYAYCANNPVMLIDPDGMKIDWSNVRGKERSYIKSALRQNIGSQTYRQMMRGLRKSDYIYTVTNSTINIDDYGEFLGSYGSRTEIPSEIQGNPPESLEIVLSGPGGHIGINYEIFGDGFTKKEFKENVGSAVLEEFVHAAQYDYYVHKYGQIDGKNALVNTEFEAKVMVGLIQGENNANNFVTNGDVIPNSFGKVFGKNFTENNYFSTMKNWRTDSNTHDRYRNKGMDINSLPEFIKTY